MKEFYDLNSFAAYILRRLLTVIIIIALCAAGCGGYRFMTSYRAYKNQDNNSKTTTSRGEPMWRSAYMVIYIPPQYARGDEQKTDISNAIVTSYIFNRLNSETISKLRDKYFDRAKEDGLIRYKNFYEYGYILEKESRAPYTAYDFQDQFVYGKFGTDRIYDYQVTSNHVFIGFRSTDEQLSKDVIKDYEALMHDFMIKEFGDYKYEVVDWPVLYEIPIPTTGSTPVRYSSGSASNSENMNLSSVVKEGIKGAIWGTLLGCALAVVVMFIAFMTRNRLVLAKDIRDVDMPLYGNVLRKKPSALAGKYIKFVNSIEGNESVFFDGQEAAAVVDADVHVRLKGQDNPVVLVSGCGKKEDIDNFAKLLSSSCTDGSITYVPCDSISKSPETILLAGKCNAAVLVESSGGTVLGELKKEIDRYSQYKVEIAGAIIVQ